MSFLRSSLVLGLLLPACSPGAGSTAPQAHPSSQREAGEVSGSDRPAMPDPLPTPADEVECRIASDCHPNAVAHATWCGPVKRDFTGSIFDSKIRPGTMDGAESGCLCHLGRCGARLNDGRMVVGQQPAYQYRPPSSQPPAGETE